MRAGSVKRALVAVGAALLLVVGAGVVPAAAQQVSGDGAWRSTGHDYDGDGDLVVPALPKGVTFTNIRLVSRGSLFFRSDGKVVANGTLKAQGFNERVPALPSGVRYVDGFATNDVRSAELSFLLLRSDGELVRYNNTPSDYSLRELSGSVRYARFGNRWELRFLSDGRVEYVYWTMPSEPEAGDEPTLHRVVTRRSDYVGGVYGAGYVILLRADGRAVSRVWDECAMTDEGNVCFAGRKPTGSVVPKLPKGVRYTQVTGDGQGYVVYVRSDGKVVTSGRMTSASTVARPKIPSLPRGVRYLRASVGSIHLALVRSDGRVVLVGSHKSRTKYGQLIEKIWKVPVLKKDHRFVDVVAGDSGTFFQSEAIPRGVRVATQITKVRVTSKKARRATVVVTLSSVAKVKGGKVRVTYKGKTIGRATVKKGHTVKVAISTARLARAKKNTIKVKYLGKHHAKASYTTARTLTP